MMDMNTRIERLRTMLAENRIVRHAWSNDDGMCLLAALSPEAATAKCPSACPVEVMPLWLAYLTPSMDDFSSIEAWPRIVRRYADIAGRWNVLDAEAWERARIASLLAIVREARSHVPESEMQALVAIDNVLAWLARGAPEDECGEVRAAAKAAAEARTAEWPLKAVHWAARTAEWAARAVQRPACAAGVDVAAAAAVEAAEWAEMAAGAASSAASAWEAEPEAKIAARAAAWDRISEAVITAIETECERAKQEE